MVKAIMHGCNGHMGRVITDIIKNTEGIELDRKSSRLNSSHRT